MGEQHGRIMHTSLFHPLDVLVPLVSRILTQNPTQCPTVTNVEKLEKAINYLGLLCYAILIFNGLKIVYIQEKTHVSLLLSMVHFNFFGNGQNVWFYNNL